MLRETALSQVEPNMEYYKEYKFSFVVKECKTWINKIYDDFESRTCENCKWDMCGCSVQDSIFICCEFDGTPTPDLDTFGCNKFTRKNND